MAEPRFDERTAASAAPAFSALGDPTRLAIVSRLCREGPLPTIELRRCAGEVSRQAVTKHLQVLEDAGLVESDRIGRDRQWRLKGDQLDAARGYLDRLSAEWDQRLARLKAFVEDEAG